MFGDWPRENGDELTGGWLVTYFRALWDELAPDGDTAFAAWQRRLVATASTPFSLGMLVVGLSAFIALAAVTVAGWLVVVPMVLDPLRTPARLPKLSSGIALVGILAACLSVLAASVLFVIAFRVFAAVAYLPRLWYRS